MLFVVNSVLYRFSSVLSTRVQMMAPASPSPFLQALRRAAPSLSREFFGCQQCRPFATKAIPSRLFPQNSLLRPKKQLGNIVQNFRQSSAVPTAKTALPAAKKPQTASRFPESSSNAVAYWLLGSAASVFGIVIFGGLTRLTESGYVFNQRNINPSPC
jgi:heme a synthase